MSGNWREESGLWGGESGVAAAGAVWKYCAGCTALRRAEDVVCEDCKAARPASGWPGVEQALDPFLGRVLMGRYLMEKIEGRGASSTVYRARSLAVPKRFAIKMVKLGFGDPARTEHARGRLEREVRAVGMLRSPHIVRIYDMMEVEDDWMALVMEHIDGETLSERVERAGPMRLAKACGLLRQVANGLCEAHQSGMVHRDIKPENIMLEQLPDGSDFAYVLDFGVVRLQNEAAMTQGFVGTPLYASPEQAVAQMGVGPDAGLVESSDGQVDIRSDIYSLGATFYYMLTGRAPFEHERALDVLRAHLDEPAPALRDALASPEFGPGVERMVARMLAKSPEDRPPNLFRVIDALQALEAGELSGFTSSMAESSLQETSVEETSAASIAHDTDRPRSDAAKTSLANASFVEKAQDLGGEVDGIRADQWRRVETAPQGLTRPQTNPSGMDSSELARLTRRTSGGKAFARDVRLVAATDERGVALVDSHNEIWMLEEGRLHPICTPPATRVCAASNASAQVFVGLRDGTVKRVDRANRTLERVFPTDQMLAGGSVERSGAMTALAATPDAGRLVAASTNGVMWLGEDAAESGTAGAYRWTRAQVDGQAALALSKQGDLFAAAGHDHIVRVAPIEHPDSPLAVFGAGAPVLDMAFSRHDDLLAVLVDRPQQGARHHGAWHPARSVMVQVYQVLAGQKLYQFTVEAPVPRTIFFSSRNTLFGVCAAHGRVGCWDLMTDRAMAQSSR